MSEMILVKSIDVALVSDSRVALPHHSKMQIPFSIEPEAIHRTFDIEHIDGEIFHTAGGKRICLGMTRQVREVLGLPLGIFEAQRERIRYMEESRSKLVYNLQRLTLWQRVKILFGADPARMCL